MLNPCGKPVLGSRLGRPLMVLLVTLADFLSAEACPDMCLCSMVGMKSDLKGQRVTCSNHSLHLSSLANIHFPLDAVVLELSDNKLAVLETKSFVQLSSLRKLNLSNNIISRVEPGAFEGLLNLRNLDLSHNELISISSGIFAGLSSLKKLWLNDNQISTVPNGSFSILASLRHVNFASSVLRCDCRLKWVLLWAADRNVLLSRQIVCSSPLVMRGYPLRRLTTDELHCDHGGPYPPLPLFEVKPASSQLVFVGDKLPMECWVSVINPRTVVRWVRPGSRSVVTANRTAGMYVHTGRRPDSAIVVHTVLVGSLERSHSGIWSCQVSTPHGNRTKDVEVDVLEPSAVSCPPVTISTVRGEYTFGSILAVSRAEKACQVGQSGRFATYLCNDSGRWTELNVADCEYVSGVTRTLDQLAREQVNETRIGEYLGRLHGAVMTVRGSLVAGVTSADVNYIADILQGLVLPVITLSSPVIMNLLWIFSNLSALPDVTLTRAQSEGRGPRRLLTTLDNLTNSVTPDLSTDDLSLTSPNIAVFVRRVTLLNISRILCTVHSSTKDQQSHFSELQLSCSPLFHSMENQPLWNESTILSVDLPASVLTDETPDHGNLSIVRLTLFHNSGFFSGSLHGRDSTTQRNVLSYVVRLSVGDPVHDLTEPITIGLRVRGSRSPAKAVYWDFSANSGLGEWQSDTCDILERTGNHTLLLAHRFAYIAVLQDTSVKPPPVMSTMEPAVYVGSGVSVLCLSLVFLTYTSRFRTINCPKKMKHSISNICLSMVMTIGIFTFGIHRTDVRAVCQVCGICLHYFVVVTAFWITVSASNVHKKLTKADRPKVPLPELESMPLPPRPILRFYFLCWGVPLIVCGITAAINLDFYVSVKCCFLSRDQSVASFYIPLACLFVVNVICYLRISCFISSQDTSVPDEGKAGEGKPADKAELTATLSKGIRNGNRAAVHTDTVDQRLRNSVNSDAVQRVILVSVNVAAVGGNVGDGARDNDDNGSIVSVFDAERGSVSQLRGLVATMTLFICVLVCGAIVAERPVDGVMFGQKRFFGYLYSVASSTFGMFMLIYHCFTRVDVWVSFKLCFSRQSSACPLLDDESHDPQAEESESLLTISTTPANLPPSDIAKSGDIPVSSGDGGNSCCFIKPSDVTDDVVTTEEIGNGVETGYCSPNSKPFVDLSTYRTEPLAANFYNPWQNGAARKFWQKNRHRKVITKNLNVGVCVADSSTLHWTAEVDKDLYLNRKSPANERTNEQHLTAVGNDSVKAITTSAQQDGAVSMPMSGISKSRIHKITASSVLSSNEPAVRFPVYHSLGFSRFALTSPALCPRSQVHVKPQLFCPNLYASMTCSLSPDIVQSTILPVVDPLCHGQPMQSFSDFSSTDVSEQLTDGGFLSDSCSEFKAGRSTLTSRCRAGTRTPSITSSPCTFTCFSVSSNGTQSRYPSCNDPSIGHAMDTSYGTTCIRQVDPCHRNAAKVLQGYTVHKNESQYELSKRKQGLLTTSGDSVDSSKCHIPISSSDMCPDILRFPIQRGTGVGHRGFRTPTPSVVSEDNDHFHCPSRCLTSSESRSLKVHPPFRNVWPADNGHHSDPIHRKRRHFRGGDSHKLCPSKQTPQGWDNQIGCRSMKTAYAYVNHRYREKVLSKLVKQVDGGGQSVRHGIWPPSHHIDERDSTPGGFYTTMAGLSASEDDSIRCHSVWLPSARDALDRFKKETSV